MSLYLTRLSMIILGVIALTTASYAVERNLATSRAHDTAANASFQFFQHTDLEVEGWKPDVQTCNCETGHDAGTAGEPSNDTKKQNRYSCEKPSPAERMGMAIRLVSL